MKEEVARLEDLTKSQQQQLNSNVSRLLASRKALATQLIEKAKKDALEERARVAVDKVRLGTFEMAAVPGAKQVWVGSLEHDEIQRAQDRNKDDKSTIQMDRRKLNQRRARKETKEAAPAPAGEEHAEALEEMSALAASGPSPQPHSGNDLETDDTWEMREIYSCRMDFLRRELNMLEQRKELLSSERALFLKRLQRLEAAERSGFSNFPTYKDRYILLTLLGKGGFAEVYKAYDLEANNFCAVKIHELGASMTNAQKQHYVRRAKREFEIQEKLNHPRVVKLQDWAFISNNAFCTVLEYCEGVTLDEFMKQHGTLSEKEARGIVIQILSGLKYMNTGGRRIIHYDLKPSNLFYHMGEVKIADFGLSKVIRDTEQEGNEQSVVNTSHGAGTYYYLPLEALHLGGTGEPQKISSKVDVWSTGVIFYELLFGRRPFGHALTQEAMLGAILQGANQFFDLKFPTSPKVTPACIEFVKRLLALNREERPDVLEAFNDSYLRPKPRAAANTVSAGSAAKSAEDDMSR